jgi:hypothetical protein
MFIGEGGFTISRFRGIGYIHEVLVATENTSIALGSDLRERRLPESTLVLDGPTQKTKDDLISNHKKDMRSHQKKTYQWSKTGWSSLNAAMNDTFSKGHQQMFSSAC